MPRQRGERWSRSKKRAAKVEQGIAGAKLDTATVGQQVKIEKTIPCQKPAPSNKEIHLPQKFAPPPIAAEITIDIAHLPTPTPLPPLPRTTQKVPMPGTPCSAYGCQKNEYGICTSCGRIRPWLERPPGYYLGRKSMEEKKRVVFEELFGEVDRLMGIVGDEGKGLEGLEGMDGVEEVRLGLEGL